MNSKKFLLILFAIILLNTATLVKAGEYVVPSGETIGIKIYADGLIVTGVAEFSDNNGNYVCPAKDAGINTGSIIKSVNGESIESSEQFEKLLDGRTLNIEITDEGQTSFKIIAPSLSSDGKYHIGAWVRDSTAGIGTLTCFNPSTLRYNALGHAITDIDTGNIMTVESGNIQECKISAINKGYVGFPGSVSADFKERVFGTIEENSETGISGTLNTALSSANTVEVAEISQTHNGDATILTDICDDTVKEYSAKVSVISENDTRSMIIEITDERLLEKTGGIVQGMSGAPVLQDGRLIGAITHVFVNEPKKGYCISADKFIQ